MGLGLAAQLEHLFPHSSLSGQPTDILIFLKKTHYFIPLGISLLQYPTKQEWQGQVPPDEWLKPRAAVTSGELMMKEDNSAHCRSPKDA